MTTALVVVVVVTAAMTVRTVEMAVERRWSKVTMTMTTTTTTRTTIMTVAAIQYALNITSRQSHSSRYRDGIHKSPLDRSAAYRFDIVIRVQAKGNEGGICPTCNRESGHTPSRIRFETLFFINCSSLLD